jgi:hypothetical protein
LAAAAVAFYAAFRKQGKSLSVFSLPKRFWPPVVQLLFWFRQRFFSVTHSERDLVVDAPPDEVKNTFCRHHFGPRWPFSVFYRGEVSSMRRTVRIPDKKHPHQQVHVRLFDGDRNKTTLHTHLEPDPFVHPWAHLEQRWMEKEPAVNVSRQILYEEDIGYEQPPSSNKT